jgi:hypothetical protein
VGLNSEIRYVLSNQWEIPNVPRFTAAGIELGQNYARCILTSYCFQTNWKMSINVAKIVFLLCKFRWRFKTCVLSEMP